MLPLCEYAGADKPVACATCAVQELISELQDQEAFGKRGEVWAFGELAAVLLLLIPPFTLTVSAVARVAKARRLLRDNSCATSLLCKPYQLFGIHA